MKTIESVDCEKIHATGAKPINKIELRQTAAKSAPQTLRKGQQAAIGYAYDKGKIAAPAAQKT